MTPTASLPATVTVFGETWRLHSIRFQHDDATFTANLYARSWKEAEAMLGSLKETGEVDGVVEGWVGGDVPEAVVAKLVDDLNESGGAS